MKYIHLIYLWFKTEPNSQILESNWFLEVLGLLLGQVRTSSIFSWIKFLHAFKVFSFSISFKLNYFLLLYFSASTIILSICWFLNYFFTQMINFLEFSVNLSIASTLIIELASISIVTSISRCPLAIDWIQNIFITQYF